MTEPVFEIKNYRLVKGIPTQEKKHHPLEKSSNNTYNLDGINYNL